MSETQRVWVWRILQGGVRVQKWDTYVYSGIRYRYPIIVSYSEGPRWQQAVAEAEDDLHQEMVDTCVQVRHTAEQPLERTASVQN